MRIHIVIIVISLYFATVAPLHVRAAAVDELKDKINDHSAKILDLNKEITTYKTQLNEVGKQAQTLNKEVKTLDLTEKKIVTDIQVTENKISITSLTITQVTEEIAKREVEIAKITATIRDEMKQLQLTDSTPLITTLLNNQTTGDFWDEVGRLEELRSQISFKIEDLRALKKDLEQKKAANVAQKADLVGYKEDLSDKKKVVEVTKQTKNELLAETKNKESNYKKILDEKIALRDSFQKELTDFESQLRLSVDLTKLPRTGSGVLLWPLDEVTVTQEFGNTEFSRSVPGLYSGVGHNGIDLRAAIGTPVKAAASGVIKGVGNTDLTCKNASYGKWIFVEHNNGLSTLYGHLSLQKVVPGQVVTAGEIIGFSGNTGYSTGPHIHFTVYATEGVAIVTRASKACGGRKYTVPAADFKAYLNPLLYL